MTGYQLHQQAEATVGHFWKEGFGRIYPALRELADAGLVTAHTEPGRGGPQRRVHALTEQGRAELRRWLDQPATAGSGPGRDDLLLKVFFGRHAGRHRTADHLRERADRLRALHHSYRAIADELAADTSEDARYWRITVRHGLLLTRAGLQWCEESVAALAGTEKDRP